MVTYNFIKISHNPTRTGFTAWSTVRIQSSATRKAILKIQKTTPKPSRKRFPLFFQTLMFVLLSEYVSLKKSLTLTSFIQVTTYLVKVNLFKPTPVP